MMFGNIGLQAWCMYPHNKKYKADIAIEKSGKKYSSHVMDLFCGHKNVLHKFHNKKDINPQEFVRNNRFRQAFKQSDKTISRHIAAIVRSECGKIARNLAQQEQHEEGRRLIWEILACSIARLHGQAKDDYFLRTGLQPSHGYLKEIGLAVKKSGIPCKESKEGIWRPQSEGGALPYIPEMLHCIYKSKDLSEVDQVYLKSEKKHLVTYIEKSLIDVLSPFAKRQNLPEPIHFKKQLAAHLALAIKRDNIIILLDE